MELEEYKKAIRELMASGSTEVISNARPAHAAALFELFFEKADYAVDILCKDLSQQVFDFDWVKKAFLKALERGVSIRLLIQEKKTHQEGILNEIKKSDSKLLQVKYADEVVRKLRFNFSIMDNKAYRYEPDSKKIIAFAQLNDSKNCETLNDTFSTLWNREGGLSE